MSVRLLPWQPEYGAGMAFAADPVDEDAPDDAGEADVTVERPVWAPVTPSVAMPDVRIVDGTRQVHAYALDQDAAGNVVFGLFGSIGVGAVEVRDRRARIADEVTRVERRYLHTGADSAGPVVAGAGLEFRDEARTAAASHADLLDALQGLMRQYEARLAEELSEDESCLTLVDGPIRSLRSPGPRTVGYVKTFHQWYIGPREIELLPSLAPGERTPLFAISAGAGSGAFPHDRYSWYVRLADLGAGFHPLAGLARLETAGGVGIEAAGRLADQTACVLPRLASSPVRDPRAPQNLTPVGALETRLTHLLGDRLLTRRMLTAAVGRGAQREASA